MEWDHGNGMNEIAYFYSKIYVMVFFSKGP